MRYVLSRMKRDSEERAYRIYISDELKYNAQNKSHTERLADILYRPKDTRSGDDIALDVIKRAGLNIVTKEGE